MKWPHLFSRLYNQPLLLSPDKARIIESVFSSYVAAGGVKNIDETIAMADVDAERPQSALANGSRLSRSRDKSYAVSTGGVAVIPVIGTLVQRSSWMDAASGMTGYSDIKAKIDEAISDTDVRAILLDVDSGGGEANGAFDLSDAIYAARDQKPLWAIANESAYSAAYAIGSAAEKLFMPRTAGVGSVGVIAMHIDQSAKNEKSGVRYTPIIAGDKKAAFSSTAPLSDAARSDMQAEVDRIYGIFVDTVARNRGIDPAIVKDTQAGLLNPDQAVSIGFADGIATFDQVLSQLESAAATTQKTIFSTTASHAVNRKEARMDQPQAQASASGSAEQNQAVELARTEAKTQGIAEGISTGASQERARIKSIVESDEAAGRSKLANHIAFNTAMSIDDAKALLAASPAEAAVQAAPANPLAAAMAGVANPKVGVDADTAGSGSAANDVDTIAKQILAAGK